MNISTARSIIRNPLESLSRTRIKSATIYSGIIILAMFAFEAFNYGTTQYALKDLLGDLTFAGISWATLMALAFCGLDFAGIARLINQKGRTESPKESWYLFGAWLIAGTFNAALTWWGVSIAIANHTLRSAAVVPAQTLITVVPVFVAILVWVVRILIIGSLTSAFERFSETRSSTERTHGSVTTTAGFPTRNQTESGYPKPAAAVNNPQPMYRNVTTSTPRPDTQRSSIDPNRIRRRF